MVGSWLNCTEELHGCWSEGCFERDEEYHSQDTVTEGTCSCAERTGELVVFSCPICCEKALLHLQGLTKKGSMIRLDKSGSVSGLVEVEEPYGQY